MNSKTREKPPLKYIKEKHSNKTTSIKFVYRGRNKKISLPIYHEGLYEEFLCLIQDVENWMIDYNLQQDLHIEQVYKNLINCLKESARDTWTAISRKIPGKTTFMTWKNDLHQYIKETLPKESARKKVKYLNNTDKPRKLTIRKWIRRIKNIDCLLPMMGGEKLDKEELIKDVIASNLPDSWIKPFLLSGAHQYDNMKKVISTLEILENDKQAYIHKPRGRNKNITPANTNEKKKTKEPV